VIGWSMAELMGMPWDDFVKEFELATLMQKG